MQLILAKLIIIFVLILLVGFFTSSETAYISLSKIKMRRMLEEKRINAKIVEKLYKNMAELLTTVLIGTNFLNSLISALVTSLIVMQTGGGGVGPYTFLIAMIITIFGQIIPKTIASLYPEKVCQFSSIPLFTLQKILFPIVWFFKKLSSIAVWLVEKIIKPSRENFTQEDLKTIIDVGEKEGTIEKDESRMLNKIIKFNDLLVSDIMKHRSFVSMVSQDATQEEVIREFLKSGFSTITVYENSPENIVGILNYKKILLLQDDCNKEKGFAKEQMSKVEFVPGTLNVIELLQKFRSEEHKFAVVLNEQGATEGIVTMEDILRNVFGRMTDENSINNLGAEERIKVIGENTFLVPGDVALEDVKEILSLNIESEDMNTIGGWLLEQFGYLPQSGTVFIKDNVIYTAEDIFKRRIVTIRIKKN